MSKRIVKILSLILIMAMAFNIAGCNKVEEFFDLGSSHGSRRDRDRDDDDEPEETEETEETEPGETEPDETDPAVITISDELTYPDHVPTYDEIHPAHAHGNVSGQEASDLLDEIEHDILVDLISSSYVDAVILFEDYESFGVTFEDDEIGWGEVLYDTDESIEENNELLEQLYSIDPDSLDTQDRIFYDKILYDAELSAYALQYTAFDYYESALKSLTGPQTQVLFVLEVIDFSSVEEAENYILLLRDLDRYFDDLCAFEEDRAAYGYVNSDNVYEAVAVTFDNLVAQSEDCFLYDSFRDRLDHIDGLSDQEREALIEEHDQVMHDIVFPEFEECADRMRALKCGAPAVGVSSYPGGDAYYAYIYATQTNSGRSIEESLAQLEAYTDSVMGTMMSVAYSGDTTWMDEYLDHDYSMGDTRDNLDYLYETIQQDFPAIPAHDYHLLTVPEVFADDFSPAAFLGYHLDNFDSNIIVTNEASISNVFGVTCAHEGYAGHMYESVYHRCFEHPYMYIAASIGYTEGWATYVENYAFKYYSTTAASQVVRVEHELNALLFARFDIGINYQGWDLQDCADWAADFLGTPLPADSFQEMADLLLSDPGYGVKYGMGYIYTGMIISQLHQDFPDASEIDIHTAYLDAEAGTYEQILENAEQFLADGDLYTPVSNWGDEFEGGAVVTSGSSDSSGGGLIGH